MPGDPPQFSWVRERTRRDKTPLPRALWDHLVPEQSVVTLGCVIANGNKHVVLAHFSASTGSLGLRAPERA